MSAEDLRPSSASEEAVLRPLTGAVRSGEQVVALADDEPGRPRTPSHRQLAQEQSSSCSSSLLFQDQRSTQGTSGTTSYLFSTGELASLVVHDLATLYSVQFAVLLHRPILCQLGKAC